LRYTLPKEHPQNDPSWIREQQAVAKKISSNPALEHLSITNFRYLHVYSAPKFDFARLFSNKDVFPNLRSLSFCSLTVSQTALMDFLYRHYATLRSLHLADIQLVPGGKDTDGFDLICTWPELLRFLQQDLSLRSVAFDGFLTTEDSSEAWEVSSQEKLCYFRRILRKDPAASTAVKHRWVKTLEVDEAGDPFYDEEQCMKRKIENWIIDAVGDCPLELARYPGPTPDHQTLQLPASWKGDYSWRYRWLDGHPNNSTIEWVRSNGNKRKHQ
jgi:hypothetical protein